MNKQLYISLSGPCTLILIWRELWTRKDGTVMVSEVIIDHLKEKRILYLVNGKWKSEYITYQSLNVLHSIAKIKLSLISYYIQTSLTWKKLNSVSYELSPTNSGIHEACYHQNTHFCRTYLNVCKRLLVGIKLPTYCYFYLTNKTCLFYL